MPKGDQPGSRRLSGRLYAVSALPALAGIVALLYGLDPWISKTQTPLKLLALNSIPMLVVWLFFVGLTGRIWASAWLTGLTTWLLYYTNQIKLGELNQPLLFTDVLLTPQLVSNTEMLGRYANATLLLAVCIAAALLFAVLIWLEKRRLRWLSMLSLAVVSVLTGWLITTPFANRVFTQHGALDTPWSPISSVSNTGLLASLAASAGKEWVELPKPDENALSEIRRSLATSHPTQKTMASAPPDIVIVLSESFFDPGVLNGVDTCDYLPRWCELKAGTESGLMRVPTFGGNTTRTEFEVLTAIPYTVLPPGIYPYTSAVRRPMASLPQWLKHLGYRTTAVHPHKRTFWQRQRAYPLLGFDRFIAEEDMRGFTRVGWFLSDSDMTNHVIRLLEDGNDIPQFVFAVSMENHGPWNKPRPNLDSERLATIPTPDDMDETAQLAWRQYIFHAHNAITELERLQAYLQQRERPAIVLFFGDHLPSLASVYEALGFRNGKKAFSQPAPYSFLSIGNTIDPGWQVRYAYQLPVMLLEFAELPLPSSYADLLLAYRDEENASLAPGIRALQLEILHQLPRNWTAEVTGPE